MGGRLLVFYAVLHYVYARHALNFRFFEEEDKNKDSKLSLNQFSIGLQKALLNSGIDRSEEMFKDFAEWYIEKMRYRDLVELAGIKKRVESGEVLKEFIAWRERMWIERIKREGKHDYNDPTYYNHPHLFGYTYKKLKKIEVRGDDL